MVGIAITEQDVFQSLVGIAGVAGANQAVYRTFGGQQQLPQKITAQHAGGPGEKNRVAFKAGRTRLQGGGVFYLAYRRWGRCFRGCGHRFGLDLDLVLGRQQIVVNNISYNFV